ncbi:MAG: hypothetical protein ACOCXG_02540 [Nanoarchaeota archaeon]
MTKNTKKGKEYVLINKKILKLMENHSFLNNTQNEIISTIRVNLETKKLLDTKKKEGESHEKVIRRLVKENELLKKTLSQIRNQVAHNIDLKFNSYERKKGFIEIAGLKFIYKYNSYHPSIDESLDDKFYYNIEILEGYIIGEKTKEKLNDAYYLFHYILKQIFTQKGKNNEKEISENIGENIIYFLILEKLLEKDFSIKIFPTHNSNLENPNYCAYMVKKHKNIPKEIINMDVENKIAKLKNERRT